AFFEPGEIARIAVPATNDGDGNATAVQVTLSTSDPGVIILTPRQSYLTVKHGATKIKRFRLVLAPSYPNGRPVTLTATTTFVGALSPTTTALTVPTGQPSPVTLDFAYTGPVVPIPDNNATGASVSIPVSGVGAISKLTFSIDGSTCTAAVGATTVGLNHSWVGD